MSFNIVNGVVSRYIGTDTDVVIPDGVTKIGREAFKYCKNLTKVVMPDSVTRIEAEAFKYCNSLTKVVIPDSVTRIDVDTFSGCENLTSVEIPNGVRSIRHGAFHGCKNLTSVVIPDSVTSIGDYAFCGCEKLTNVVIPEGVTNIGNGAFQGCKNLTSVVIPNSVTSIGYGVFRGCGKLDSVLPESGVGIDFYRGDELCIEDSTLYFLIEKKDLPIFQNLLKNPYNNGLYFSIEEKNGFCIIRNPEFNPSFFLWNFGEFSNERVDYTLFVGLELYCKLPEMFFCLIDSYEVEGDADDFFRDVENIEDTDEFYLGTNRVSKCWVGREGELRYSHDYRWGFDDLSIRIDNGQLDYEIKKGRKTDYKHIFKQANEYLKTLLSENVIESQRSLLFCVHVLLGENIDDYYLCRFDVKIGDRVYVSGYNGNVLGTVIEILDYFSYDDGDIPEYNVVSVVDDADCIGEKLPFDRYVKIQFPDNKKYSYLCEFDVKVGDVVYVSGKKADIPGIVCYIHNELPQPSVLSHAQRVLKVEKKT